MNRLLAVAMLSCLFSSFSGCCLLDRISGNGCRGCGPSSCSPCDNQCDTGCNSACNNGCNSGCCSTGRAHPGLFPKRHCYKGGGLLGHCLGGGGHHGLHGNGNGPGNGGYVPGGPGAAQVTYPYYTTRGPRDYFDCGGAPHN